MRLKDINKVYRLEDLPVSTIKEIQECLSHGKYLEPSQVDGIIGPITKKAFADFKEDVWMQDPDIIGKGSVQPLLELKVKRHGTHEASVIPDTSLKLLGTMSGRTMVLPTAEKVFENQYIVKGIPLTWGEATKGCTRIPRKWDEVRNAITLAKAFGVVREKFGSPILITSGYRPPRVNSAVGGVSNSQHIYFNALDMVPLNRNYRKLWHCLKASSFTGLGDAVSSGKGFYHADIRSGGRIIFGY